MIRDMLFWGSLYLVVELIFTSFFRMGNVNINNWDTDNNGVKDGKTLRFGYASIWMFFPAALLGLTFRLLFANPFFSMWYSIPVFMMYTGVAITLIELVLGSAFLFIFKIRLWDYTGEKYCYKGHICLKHCILWILAGLPIWLLQNFVI